METFPHNEKIDFSKKMNVKFGIDPTAEQLHLGHLVPLLFVKKLLNDGHNIDIILGTFTAQLGDPSGKNEMRPMLDKTKVISNAEKLLVVIKRILVGDFNTHFNHTWFDDMGAVEMMNMLSKFTTGRLLSRDSFQKRMEDNNGIGMHELVVPILQGFDSVQLMTDLEIGGSDQLFNFSVTRDLQRSFGQDPEACVLMPIINGTDGRKMSKSFGNCVFLDDSPNDVFGKTMSISDTLMDEWFWILLDAVPTQHKMESKKRLAFEITKMIWSEPAAHVAMRVFHDKIQKGGVPEDIELMDEHRLVDVVKCTRVCSTSEARRLMVQGAVRVNDVKTLEDCELKTDDIVKIGKLDFVKIR